VLTAATDRTTVLCLTFNQLHHAMQNWISSLFSLSFLVEFDWRLHTCPCWWWKYFCSTPNNVPLALKTISCCCWCCCCCILLSLFWCVPCLSHCCPTFFSITYMMVDWPLPLTSHLAGSCSPQIGKTGCWPNFHLLPFLKQVSSLREMAELIMCIRCSHQIWLCAASFQSNFRLSLYSCLQ